MCNDKIAILPIVPCRNGEFIFRSSNSVKPATDLPEDMIKRVRAATSGYCLREVHPHTHRHGLTAHADPDKS